MYLLSINTLPLIVTEIQPGQDIPTARSSDSPPSWTPWVKTIPQSLFKLWGKKLHNVFSKLTKTQHPKEKTRELANAKASNEKPNIHKHAAKSNASQVHHSQLAVKYFSNTTVYILK